MKTVLSPDDWAQLQTLFNQAIDLPFDEQKDFLDTACKDRPGLRTQLDSLLRAAQDDASVIGSLVQRASAQAADGALPAPGERIGAYQLTRVIGRGGMGIVYEAVRADDQYRKKVAIKLVAAGLLTRDLLPRFRAERQILANLDHPNIARLFDGGTTDTGLPYVVLEYVAGLPIDTYCGSHSLSVAQRLDLFIQVAKAVNYAHQNLVVHRDLKPGNILVAEDGTPKLLDFGIAKLLEIESDERGTTLETTHMMTPEYASPEQVLGKPVSTATDVYQLGVVLYELLTGSRPFVQGGRATRGELERAIVERPATRPKVDPDLDRVVLKALEKEPYRRYPSAIELAEDIERYRQGFPVKARPASFTYVARKFVRRNRFGVAAAAVALLVIIGFAIGMAVLANRARTEARTAEQVTRFLTGLFEANDPNQGRGDIVTARELLDKGAARLDRELQNDPIVKARLLDTMGSLYTSLGSYAPAEKLLKDAIAIRQRVAGTHDITTAESVMALGVLYQERSRYDDAERLYREALATLRAKLGDKDVRVAEGMSNLASVLWDTGRFAESEQLDRQSITLFTKLRGPAHPQTLDVMNDLETVLFSEGNFTEAESLARQILKAREKIEPADHPDLGFSWGNLSNALDRLGRFREAEDAARRCLAIRVKAYGDLHPQTAMARTNLSFILPHTGKVEEALALAHRAVDEETKLAGPQGRDTAYAHNSLGQALLASGDPKGARKQYEASLQIRRSIFGEQHPTIAQSLQYIGEADVALGDVKLAREEFHRAVEIAAGKFGREHIFTTAPEIRLAEAAADEGDLKAAEAMAAHALSVNRTRWPAGHPETALAARTLGWVYYREGEVQRATQLLQEAYDADQHVWGAHAPRTARSAVYLASCLEKLGRSETAARLIREYATAAKPSRDR